MFWCSVHQYVTWNTSKHPPCDLMRDKDDWIKRFELHWTICCTYFKIHARSFLSSAYRRQWVCQQSLPERRHLRGWFEPIQMHLPAELEWLPLSAPNPDRSVPTPACHWHLTVCLLIRNMSLFPLQHRPSGAWWMTRPSAADLAVPRWTRPNTAAVTRASTWAAPLKTASVKVSSIHALLAFLTVPTR